jgi:hypothetical protein
MNRKAETIARSILDLINSRPRTPSVGELTDLIADHLDTPAPALADNSLDGNGRRYWDVISTGKWAEDCRTGEEYGRIYLETVRSGKRHPLLCWIVHDMITRGQYTGVEIGFIQKVFAAVVG